MKVLLVGHTYAAAVNQSKLECLASLGIDLSVLVPSNWRSLGLFAGKTFEVHASDARGFQLAALPVWRSGHAASHLYGLGTACRFIRRFGPDIVHIENEAYSFVAGQFSAAARLLRVKSTLFVWENVDQPVHPLQAVCRRLSLSQVAGVVCGSEGARKLIRKWGFSGSTAVIPQLGVDAKLFGPSSGGQRSAILTLGFVGRLVPEKGCDLLLTAVRRVADLGFYVRCVLCGSGPSKQSLIQLADELGIADRTSFLDEVPHESVPEVLRMIDVCVLPSRASAKWAEQFGHVLIEAMCAGCMVVGARSGAIPDVIGRSDLTFDEGDADGLSRILARLAGDPGGHAALHAYFRDRVETHYTQEAIARQFAAFWDKVAGSSVNE